jgi:Family of unknown function (DUF6184)
MLKGYSVAFFLFAVAGAACGHSYSETSTPSTTGGTAPRATVHQEAVNSIASARCKREERCDNIGPNKHYVSADGCMTQLRGEGMNELNSSSCPNGIDSAQLDKCLADIHGERCENALDALSRLSSCSTGSLCAH